MPSGVPACSQHSNALTQRCSTACVVRTGEQALFTTVPEEFKLLSFDPTCALSLPKPIARGADEDEQHMGEDVPLDPQHLHELVEDYFSDDAARIEAAMPEAPTSRTCYTPVHRGERSCRRSGLCGR